MAEKLKNIVKAFADIGEDHNLPDHVVEAALAEAMEKAYQKQTGIKEIKVKTEMKNGQLNIYHIRDVVEAPEEVEDDELQISLEEARKKNPVVEVGGEDYEPVDFTTFDRAAVVLAKNVMKQKIREAEKAEVYENFKDKVNEMINGFVERTEEKFVLVRLGGTPDGKKQPGSTDAMMKLSDQIPTEKYTEKTIIPVVVTEVNKESKGPIVMVSRADPIFIKRLFEKEVPEIFHGIIEVKSIARDPGHRAKIAVYSHNENIDPIGACIGPRGSRVQSIINALNGEKIDILEWDEDVQKYVANALAPAQNVIVVPKEDGNKKSLYAVVPDDQLSLAIGKRGQNARLAVKLTGYKIDIKSESQMKELGIDYKALAKAMHDEFEEKKEQERLYKQQKRIDELKTVDEGSLPIDHVDFMFEADMEPDDQHLAKLDTLAAMEVAASIPELPKPEEVPQLPDLEEDQEEPDEMEIAARLARENRKSLSERRSQYTSRLETPEEKTARPAESKGEAKSEKAENRKKAAPAIKKTSSFAAMQPIYTEEELREIEEDELEEELSASWNEDVDYEEYDSYYDEKY